jgi:hypothetical protein
MDYMPRFDETSPARFQSPVRLSAWQIVDLFPRDARQRFWQDIRLIGVSTGRRRKEHETCRSSRETGQGMQLHLPPETGSAACAIEAMRQDERHKLPADRSAKRDAVPVAEK